MVNKWHGTDSVCIIGYGISLLTIGYEILLPWFYNILHMCGYKVLMDLLLIMLQLIQRN